MIEAGVPGIDMVDTRGLTLRIRRGGAMRAAVSSAILDPDELLAQVRAIPEMEGLGLVGEVSCAAPVDFEDDTPPSTTDSSLTGSTKPCRRVALFDYGYKSNIARLLRERVAARNCRA